MSIVTHSDQWSVGALSARRGSDLARTSYSRRQSNRSVSSYPPDRIRISSQECDALQLSPSERVYLLGLARHPEIPTLPTEKEVEQVRRELIPVLESLEYPSTLMDEGERIWYYSHMAVKLPDRTW
jgi:hypothetical protein